MDTLGKIWELISAFFGGLSKSIEKGITSVFGSANARFIKRLQPKIDAIGALEPKCQAMDDDELRAQTDLFRERLAAGETLDDILIEVFAVCREAGRRYLSMRHYDVQLVGGIVLHQGNIAEMVTGEGKTLVATLAAYLNGLSGLGVHVVTVNDYLARRDMEWMSPIFLNLGLTVGAIQSNMKADERQQVYDCDITYGTNNEFGFDYLRDNMRIAARGDDRYPKRQQQAQGRLNFAIIDEVDNILIDEARTPLIISGSAHDDITKYSKADQIARKLKKDVDFQVSEKDHSAHLTDEGVRVAEELAGVESFYTVGNMEWPHLIDNSLKAHHLYKIDVNYVVQGGKIIIVDEFTGRLMEGRQWSDGLHQAVEAKERVEIKEETQTLATITLQNYFKLYDRICGMTGTALTEASEFWKVYKLDVVAILTNRPMRRTEHPDVIYMTEKAKYKAMANEIERVHKWDVLTLDDGSELVGSIIKENREEITIQLNGSKNRDSTPKSRIKHVQRGGRPILVGTVSIEKSERLANLLGKRGIPHEILNAKHHKREAEIVAQAGRKDAVTIATNMAGRGTDIVLGGNAETMAWARLQDTYDTRLDVPSEEWETMVADIENTEGMKAESEEVKELGGLYVIGSERHEARRIDLQLRGRTGRQGDPGESRFFLSLEDDLMRIFAGEWVKSMLGRMGMKEDDAIESKMVSRRIAAAQKKVEERHFESRKSVLEYDEVMDEQRKQIYRERQDILDGMNCREKIAEMVRDLIQQHLAVYLNKDYGSESYAGWAGSKLSVAFDARDFRGMDVSSAEEFAKDQAARLADRQIDDAIAENLPDDVEDRNEWNWEALAKMFNMRWQLGTNDRELKKIPLDEIADQLKARVKRVIEKADLNDGQKFLGEQFGYRVACEMVNKKFGISFDFDEVCTWDQREFQSRLLDAARQRYDEKEAEFPVLAGMSKFQTRDGQGQKRFDREQLVAWASDRFDVQLSLDDIKSKQRNEIRAMLLTQSQKNQEHSVVVFKEGEERIKRLFRNSSGADKIVREVTGNNGELSSLNEWFSKNLNVELSDDELSALSRSELEESLLKWVEDRFRPEIRKLERILILEILDEGWKNHLLAMDHLRSSIGLRGYAQVDPKVEYKREGMRIFDTMRHSVYEQVTDLIFKMEDLDKDFVSQTFIESDAIHEQAQTTSEMADEEAFLENAGGEDVRIEPIRNKGPRVGRNEPCPCGSGRKYKNCCM